MVYKLYMFNRCGFKTRLYHRVSLEQSLFNNVLSKSLLSTYYVQGIWDAIMSTTIQDLLPRICGLRESQLPTQFQKSCKFPAEVHAPVAVASHIL